MSVHVEGAWAAFFGGHLGADEVLSLHNAGSAADDPVERIVQLAAHLLAISPIRVDLY